MDINYDIPGTTKGYILNMLASDTAITWRQYLPMFRFQLYATNSLIIPWAQVMMGYLRISKLRQHVVVKNILPSSAKWQPFAPVT
jgi:hypothetical protein